MLNENEIIEHPKQTFLEDYLADYEDKSIYKCKTCLHLGSSKQSEYICINSLSDYHNKDVYKCKGCRFYDNEKVFDYDDDITPSLF